MILILFLLALFLFWAFFLTTITHALTRLGETRSLEIARNFPKRFFYLKLQQRLFKNPTFELVIFASTLGENLARLGYAGTAVFWMTQISPLSVLDSIGILAILLVLILLIGDFFPRILALKASENVLTFSFGIGSTFLCLSLPISYVFLKFANLATQAREKRVEEGGGDLLEEMRETILDILHAANVKGKLNSSDKKLIESVVKFKDRIVREVMVPRVDLFSLPAETPIRKAAHEMAKEGYSRIPVYRETIDEIVGVVMFKDILELYMDCADQKKENTALESRIETMAKNVFYTPETKKVSHLLQEFRAKQMHMAIVVDEYGGTEGVVTMEDILEEIVGEIADEYDIDEELLYTTQPGGKGWIVDARMTIIDAEEIFGILIPQEGDYDTIGGYIFHKVGSIPEKGLKIHHDEFDIEILSSSERLIEKVKVTPRTPEEEI